MKPLIVYKKSVTIMKYKNYMKIEFDSRSQNEAFAR